MSAVLKGLLPKRDQTMPDARRQ